MLKVLEVFAPAAGLGGGVMYLWPAVEDHKGFYQTVDSNG